MNGRNFLVCLFLPFVVVYTFCLIFTLVEPQTLPQIIQLSTYLIFFFSIDIICALGFSFFSYFIYLRVVDTLGLIK
jgi:hypothetical protein